MDVGCALFDVKEHYYILVTNHLTDSCFQPIISLVKYLPNLQGSDTTGAK